MGFVRKWDMFGYHFTLEKDYLCEDLDHFVRLINNNNICMNQ